MKKQTNTEFRSKIRWGIVGIFALLLVTVFFDAPTYVNTVIGKVNTASGLGIPSIPEKAFRLGLDLQGGAQLIYEANVQNIPLSERGNAVEGVRDVIERRVNGLGVGEPNIQTAKTGDAYRINVELPGVTDVNDAIRRIGETPILEFREENTTPPRELTEEEETQIATYNDTTKNKLEDVKKELDGGATFESLVTMYSEDTESKINNGYLGFISSDIAEESIYNWAAKAKEGDTSPVIESEGGYHIFKKGASKAGEKEVEASHILICYKGALRCNTDEYTKEQALQKATELFTEANARNFSSLAKKFSTEANAGTTGGELGYFKKGVLVEPFENAVFNAEVGQIIGPVETQFGYHIIYKTDERDTQEYELSHIFLGKQLEADIIGTQEPFIPTALSGKQLERAQVVSNPQTGEVQVSLQFNAEGTNLFAELTKKHLGKAIAIYLDGEPLSVPVVQTVITDGQAVITGGFTVQDAQLLAQRLNAGALPVPVELIGQQTVGASLGAESLSKSLYAGAIAMILVMIYMVLYYRLPGVLSVVALSVYLALTLALFKLVGVTLTLAGIAGCILSIGMAVDANVLIFERIKEELKKGKSLQSSVEEGFLRAWPAIKDGNISTILTCVLLIWLGSSFVKGFAFTLAIGILVSMFSAITITRVMLRFVVPWVQEKSYGLFWGVTKK